MVRWVRDRNARRVTRVSRGSSIVYRRSMQTVSIAGGIHGIGDLDREAASQTLGEAFRGRLRGVDWERVFTLHVQTRLE